MRVIKVQMRVEWVRGVRLSWWVGKCGGLER